MTESERVSKLVAYFDTTLDLIQHKTISEEQGRKILNSLEPELSNKRAIYSYIQYYNTYKFNYWYNFLFSKDEEALDYLTAMTHSRYASSEALEKIIPRFLKMPKKVKKQFYETNFTRINADPKRNIPYVEMCEQPFFLAKEDTIFHNLPTLYIQSSKSKINEYLLEKIIDDMQKVLKLDHSQFLDIYGNALIHTLDNSYIYKNWYNLEIDKRKNFQESFATRLIYRGNLKYDSFENLLEKNILPYDVKYPKGEKYLLSLLIEHKLYYVNEYLRTNPFSEEELKERMEKTKKYMIEVNQKYDLYFFNNSILEESSKQMTANLISYHRGKDKSKFSQLEGEVLKYQFEIDDIFKKRELVATKKFKL
jgi:hypothetical protein